MHTSQPIPGATRTRITADLVSPRDASDVFGDYGHTVSNQDFDPERMKFHRGVGLSVGSEALYGCEHMHFVHAGLCDTQLGTTGRRYMLVFDGPQHAEVYVIFEYSPTIRSYKAHPTALVYTKPDADNPVNHSERCDHMWLAFLADKHG